MTVCPIDGPTKNKGRVEVYPELGITHYKSNALCNNYYNLDAEVI